MKSHRTQALVLLVIGLVCGVRQSPCEGIDLGPEQFVQANGVDIQVPGYSVPSLADWNGDGVQDLIIGEGGGGLPGKVRVYLNVGTNAQPQFRDFSYAKSNGSDLTCDPNGCMGCFPRVVDWDQDGRIDLLVGQADGNIRIFGNWGGLGSPMFDGGARLFTILNASVDLDVGDRATPVPVDWNNDGGLDVVSGGLDGRIHIFYNCGCGGYVPPHFYHSPVAGLLAQANGQDLVVPGLRSSPAIADLDGDGRKDLLTGNTDGQLLFYKNVGLDGFPTFSGYSLVTSVGNPIDLPGSLRTRPFLCHWTGDVSACWDLLVGYGDGKVRLYRSASGTTDTGKTVTVAGDLNGDGVVDGNDFTILCKALGQTIPSGGSPADLNHDGVVDNNDLRVFADLWLATHK